jgi:S1/P1 Nuclease
MLSRSGDGDKSFGRAGHSPRGVLIATFRYNHSLYPAVGDLRGMRKLTALAALLCVLGVTSNACAWGDEGHKTICQFAFETVKPSTRAAIVRLIQADGQFQSFSDACTWTDHPRKRAGEHFVNLARDASGLTADCGVTSPCAVTAIAKDFAVLSSGGATDADKAASLKFLGHWVGDVHQLLHTSRSRTIEAVMKST